MLIILTIDHLGKIESAEEEKINHTHNIISKHIEGYYKHEINNLLSPWQALEKKSLRMDIEADCTDYLAGGF